MVIVTGATGHIGNVLVRELLAHGENVRALVLPGDSRRPLDGLKVGIITGDINDIASLKVAFIGADTVYHLAGIVTIIPRMEKILQKVNVGGVKNVISACRTAGVRRLVYTSSIHAIAEPPHGTFIDESQPFDPDRVLGDYAQSKARATLIMLAEATSGGLEIVVCCPTGVIGPYDFGVSNIGQLIIDFASGALKSYVSGAYDYVDVRDVARGLILAAEKGKSGRHYIPSGQQVQVLEMMQQLSKDLGYPAPTYRIPKYLARLAGIIASPYYRLIKKRPVFTAYSIDVLASNSQVSPTRACHELGFFSRPWQESLHDQVVWFREAKMLPVRRS